MRPAFIAQGRLKSRTWFSRTGLDNLHESVEKKLDGLFMSIAVYCYFTLAGDGFKTESGHKVVNFTEQASDKVAFKTSDTVELARENSAFYVEKFKAQIESRPIQNWCGCVGDNVIYMKLAFEELATMFPTILFYGCVAHLLDLLCEDYADLLKDVVEDFKDIVKLVIAHSRVKEYFMRMKGPTGIGLRNFPDTRFSYAALMIFSVLENKRSLKMMCIDDAVWAELTQNSDGSRIAGVQDFEDSVNSTRMWLRGQDAFKLLNPVAVALRFIEGNSPRMSFVYLLMMALSVDLQNWEPANLGHDIKQRAQQVFAERWQGVRTGGRRKQNIAPLYNPLHILAFYMDPYVSWTKHQDVLPNEVLEEAEKIFKKFCDSDAELRAVRQAFEGYCAGTGDWVFPKRRAAADTKVAFQELLAKHLEDNKPAKEEDLCRTQIAVLECMAALGQDRENAVTWWINSCRNKKLREIAVRVLSCCPTSACVERMNSMHKLVQTKTRAALKHERVVKLLFCYVNMRLLDNVDVDILGMVEDALMYELDCEEAEQAEQAGPVVLLVLALPAALQRVSRPARLAARPGHQEQPEQADPRTKIRNGTT